MYDQISSNVIMIPNTTPIPINFIGFTRYSSNYTGDLNTYDINLEINDYLVSYSGSVQIYFPLNAVGTLGFSPIACFLVDSLGNENTRQCTVTLYSSDNSVNYVQVNDVCQNSSCQSEIILLRLINMRNPLSMKPLGNLNTTNFYGVQTLTLDNKIIGFSTTNNLTGIGLVESAFKNLGLTLNIMITSFQNN